MSSQNWTTFAPIYIFDFCRGNLQFCDLYQLADLSTELGEVRSTIADAIVDLQNMNIFGLRLDSASCIPATDLKAIFDIAATRSAKTAIQKYMVRHILVKGWAINFAVLQDILIRQSSLPAESILS